MLYQREKTSRQFFQTKHTQKRKDSIQIFVEEGAASESEKKIFSSQAQIAYIYYVQLKKQVVALEPKEDAMPKPKKIRGYQIALRLGMTWKVFASHAEALGYNFASAQNSLLEEEALQLEQRVRGQLAPQKKTNGAANPEESGNFEVFEVEPPKGIYAQYADLAEEALVHNAPARKNRKPPRKHTIRRKSATLSDIP